MGLVAFKVAYYAQKTSKDDYKRIALWSCYGTALFAVGMVINFSFMPLNKKLWTTSFALVTSGLAALFLAFISWVVDINQYSRIWTEPFLWVGSNPLFMYVVPTFITIIILKIKVATNVSLYSWFFRTLFASWIPSAKLASLLFGICWELLFWPAALLMFKKQIFIKI